MKKTIGFILTLILLSISTLAYAATPTYDVKITSPKTELNTLEEVKVTVSIKNATGITNGIYACMGKLEYDTEVFEKVTQESFEGSGSPFYNENNGKFIVETNGITSEGDIFTITLKVKETATIGTTGEIKITEFSASEGDEDIKANNDTSVKIKVIGQTTDTDDNSSDNIGNNNNNNQNNNNNTNGTINNGSNNSTNKPITDTQKEDTTKSPTPVPQTGETSVIIISIITVIIIGAFSYTKYKKYIKL